MIRVGLVGVGYWGPKLARVLNQNQRCKFVACCDLNKDNLHRITQQYPSLKGFTAVDEMLKEGLDAVAISTPISTHFAIAQKALNSGLHVMVEKRVPKSSRASLTPRVSLY